MALTEAEKARLAAALNAAKKVDSGEITDEERRATIAAAGSAVTEQSQTGSVELLKAPYRFVTLPDQVVKLTDGQIPEISTPLEDGFCASIKITWAAETPLLVGEASQVNADIVGPIKTSSGKYFIPGASLRGMIRSAFEIVTFSRLHQVNRHHRYGLRDFEHEAYVGKKSDDGEYDRSKLAYPVSRVQDVKAGWLKAVPDTGPDWEYEITPCEWSQIEIEDMLTVSLGGNGIFVMVGQKSNWTSLDLMEKYRIAEMRGGEEGAYFIKTDSMHSFSDCGEINNKRTISFSNNGPITGTLVFSSKTPSGNKKFEYVFHDAAGAEAVALSKDAFEQFELIHSKPSKNKPVADGSWKVLKPMLEAGHCIPVFYVGELEKNSDAASFAFGLTRLFKVPHKHSVGDIIDRQGAHRPPKIDLKDDKLHMQCDFTESLFGFVYEGDEFDWLGPDDKRPASIAQKGRIAFSFGSFSDQEGLAEDQESVRTIMMGPKASFAPFYLRGPFKDYSDSDARIAGRKRYLPRYPAGQRETAGGDRQTDGSVRQMVNAQFEQASDKIKKKGTAHTDLKFLSSSSGGDLLFESEIRLHNVSAQEIGAVLWALTHGGPPDKPYRHMLGRAKPFGAGQLRIKKADLAIEANMGEKSESAKPFIKQLEQDELPGEGREGFCSKDSSSHKPFIDAFIKFMEEQLKSGWRNSETIKEFLGTSKPDEGGRLAADGKLEYITDVKKFGDVRKMTKRKSDGSTASYPDINGGRYLKTPAD